MIKGLEIEKVVNLTPLQEGMLVHALMEPESQAYYEQLRISIREIWIGMPCKKAFSYWFSVMKRCARTFIINPLLVRG